MSEASTQPMSRAIPTKRILINDPSQLPHDYSSTPGGTLFSTTPGGTRIIYDRNFLMQCRNSPLTKSPPKNLPKIPGVTAPADPGAAQENKIEEEKTKPAGALAILNLPEICIVDS